MVHGLQDCFRPRFPFDRLVECQPRIRASKVIPVGARPATHEALVNGTTVRLVRDWWGRSWFECPRCGRQCRQLYLEQFACRTCCGFDYSSRHVARWAPGVRRVVRWRRQLAKYGVDPNPFTPISRIRGSRDRIHRIVRQILTAEAVLLGDLHAFTQDFVRREQRNGSGEPH